jgi:hypothetical protein
VNQVTTTLHTTNVWRTGNDNTRGNFSRVIDGLLAGQYRIVSWRGNYFSRALTSIWLARICRVWSFEEILCVSLTSARRVP